MGHIGNKRLKSLRNQKLLGKDYIDTVDFCETCVLDKSHKESFKFSSHRTNRPLDIEPIDPFRSLELSSNLLKINYRKI